MSDFFNCSSNYYKKVPAASYKSRYDTKSYNCYFPNYSSSQTLNVSPEPQDYLATKFSNYKPTAYNLKQTYGLPSLTYITEAGNNTARQTTSCYSPIYNNDSIHEYTTYLITNDNKKYTQCSCQSLDNTINSLYQRKKNLNKSVDYNKDYFKLEKNYKIDKEPSRRPLRFSSPDLEKSNDSSCYNDETKKLIDRIEKNIGILKCVLEDYNTLKKMILVSEENKIKYHIKDNDDYLLQKIDENEQLVSYRLENILNGIKKNQDKPKQKDKSKRLSTEFDESDFKVSEIKEEKNDPEKQTKKTTKKPEKKKEIKSDKKPEIKPEKFTIKNIDKKFEINENQQAKKHNEEKTRKSAPRQTIIKTVVKKLIPKPALVLSAQKIDQIYIPKVDVVKKIQKVVEFNVEPEEDAQKLYVQKITEIKIDADPSLKNNMQRVDSFQISVSEENVEGNEGNSVN